MTLLQWSWQAFFFKFMTSQATVILSLIRARNSDPWAWAELLFYGLLIAAGADTAKWIYDSSKGPPATPEEAIQDEP